MNMLTGEQRNLIRNFLKGQGLTFDPLLDEMVDHMASDIEERMERGIAFDEALQNTKREIPEHHLQTIQLETMETINKRFTISKALSFLALGLMFFGTMFKILHYPGAEELLLLSFVAIAGGLLSTTLSGIYVHKEKKGAFRVLSIVTGALLLMVAYSFKFMHLPGADVFVVLGVGLSFVSLVFNTLYVYRNSPGEGNLLTYLHEKYTPGIERFFLYILVPIAILKIITLPHPGNVFIGGILLVVIIFGSGLQFFVLTWREIEKDPGKRVPAVLTATIISVTCFILVFLGNMLGIEIRLLLIMIFSAITAWLTWKIDMPKNIFIIFLLFLVPVVFVANASLGLGTIPESWIRGVFNIGVLLILTAGVFISKKHEATRTFFILSLASYILEYKTFIS